ncbi:MAG TPA: hypothetical protein VHH73_12555 [Verrucomicrobiae bacterium]|nr:hypothetical protein [Verrucomicrobiae bacterium]
MSLINDGLKRAKQAQAKRPATPAPGVKLEPVAGLERRPNWLAWVAPLVIVLLLCGGSWMIWRAWKGKAAPPVEVARANVPEKTPAPAPPPAAVTVARKVEASSEAAKPKLNISTNLVTRVIPAPETKPVASAEAPARPPTEKPAPSPIVPPPTATTTAASPPEPTQTTTAVPATTTSRVVTEVAAPKPPAPAPQSIRTANDFPILKLQGIFYRRSHPSVLINGKTLFVGDEILEAKVGKIERQSVTVEWQGQTKTLYLQ